MTLVVSDRELNALNNCATPGGEPGGPGDPQGVSAPYQTAWQEDVDSEQGCGSDHSDDHEHADPHTTVDDVIAETPGCARHRVSVSGPTPMPVPAPSR